MERILPIEPYKKYSRIKHIGTYTNCKCLYKYLPLDSFRKCLKGNTILFQQPTKWKDPFEARFYNANYNNIQSKGKFSKKFFACCVTKKSCCEAAWRMYSEDYENNPCIQVCLAIGQVRYFLNQFAVNNNTWIYEGNIKYDLSDKEISTLHLKTNAYHDEFFKDFTLGKYLNLMLLKRQAFEYEDEVRFFIHGGDLQMQNEKILVPIPWSLCMNNIKLLFDINNHQEIRAEIKDILDVNLSLCKQTYPNWYPQCPKISQTEIFKPIEKITIEPV